MAHVVQRHALGAVLDGVQHAFHAGDEAVDLLAVNRGDEGLVDELLDLLRRAVGGALGLIHGLVVLLALSQVGVARHHVGKSTYRHHGVVGMLVEHLEKIAFFGQQLAKQHAGLLVGFGVKNVTNG